MKMLGHNADTFAYYPDAMSLEPIHITAPMIAEALGLGPERSEIPLALANVLTASGRAAEAIPLFLHVLTARPTAGEALVNLGVAYYQTGRFVDAVETGCAALVAGIDTASLRNNLGNALKQLGRHDEALVHLRAAAQIDPANAKIWMNLGNVALEAGASAEAALAYGRAVWQSPEDPSHHRALASVHRYGDGDLHLTVMERLAAEQPSVDLHFALGKAYDDLGRHDSAFYHWTEGNALARAGMSYDEAGTMALFDMMENQMTAAMIERHAGQGCPSAVPVFVVGMPRSGTSLVEQILSCIPGVEGLGERFDFREAFDKSGAIPEENAMGHWLAGLGQSYVDSVVRDAPGAAHVVDKLPANFFHAGLIHLALPQAKIVHVQRDPIDTCLSCYSLRFTGEQAFAYDLGELGRYWRRYDRLMAHWRRVLPASAFIEIRYEGLIEDFQTHARRLVERCGLEWSERCMTFHQTPRVVKTASAAQVRQPLYRGSMGRAQAYAPYLGPLMTALGESCRSA